MYAPPGATCTPGPEDLNGWRGFRVEPESGDWSGNRQHLLEVVCASNEATFNWVMNWCAALVQQPGKHANTGIVLLGGQGIGKGHVVDKMLGGLFDSRHYSGELHNRDRVFGSFNEILAGLCLLFLDESTWGGSHQDAGIMKGLITSDTLNINRKFIAAERMPSMLHVVIASNEEWPVGIDKDDRRFCVLRVCETHKNDIAYFTELHGELHRGGLSAFLYELQAWSIDWDALRQPPDSAAKRDLKRRGWDLKHIWLEELLERFTAESWGIDASKHDAQTYDRRRIVCKEALVNEFLEWHKARGKPVQNAAVRQALGTLLNEHCPETWNANPVLRVNGKVTRDYWTLPPLDILRGSFAAARGVDRIESEPVQPALKTA